MTTEAKLRETLERCRAIINKALGNEPLTREEWHFCASLPLPDYDRVQWEALSLPGQPNEAKAKPKNLPSKCWVRKCGKEAHADLWIESHGSWVSFCTPHARFALKPTYAEQAKPDEALARSGAEREVVKCSMEHFKDKTHNCSICEGACARLAALTGKKED